MYEVLQSEHSFGGIEHFLSFVFSFNQKLNHAGNRGFTVMAVEKRLQWFERGSAFAVARSNLRHFGRGSVNCTVPRGALLQACLLLQLQRVDPHLPRERIRPVVERPLEGHQHGRTRKRLNKDYDDDLKVLINLKKDSRRTPWRKKMTKVF